MSYPPTEAASVSNDSLFSDSVEFDYAQKDRDGAMTSEQAIIAGGLERGLLPEEMADNSVNTASTYHPSITNIHETQHMKARQTPCTKPVRWKAIELKPTRKDVADEFDISSAREAIYDHAAAHSGAERGEAGVRFDFKNGEPDCEGEISNCFDEPGLLYRIINKPKRTWAFYNDCVTFEVHVTCTFGKHSKIEALNNTVITRNEETGEYIAEVVIYPCETEYFVRGNVNGFTSKLSAVPISDEYFEERSQRQWDGVISPEMEAIKDVLPPGVDVNDSEAVLQACVEHNLPFVDFEFPPCQASIDTGAAQPFKKVIWARPSMYLPPPLRDQVRLFRSKIKPGKFNQGELGDCWLTCAVATLSEDAEVIMGMFRHPKSVTQGRRERAVGAYRVTFNKNGLWRSVIVDDYLPVVGSVPLYSSGIDPCEIWPAILQKAYAKLHRSYARIQAGDPVHALTDMTGCPNVRFDEAFTNAAGSTVTAKAELFEKVATWSETGNYVILITPGKALAIIPGTGNSIEMPDEPEVSSFVEQSGLLPGHAYTVLEAYNFAEHKVRLVCLRRAWAHEVERTGDWSQNSSKWTEYPDIAAAVRFDPQDSSLIWLTWESALTYCTGGGVCLSDGVINDYRVPLTFHDCRPGIVLEMFVRTSTKFTMSLSNADNRTFKSIGGGNSGALGGSSDAATSNSDDECGDGSDVNYPPIMLSVCAPNDSDPDLYDVIFNTTSDIAEPSNSMWIFLQAREIYMECTLEPKEKPYLIIPRLMETPNTLSTLNEGGERVNLRDLVDPIHLSNTSNDSSESSAAVEVPVTFGLRSIELLAGSESRECGNTLQVRHFDSSSWVFENYPQFSADDLTEIASAYYQRRSNQYSGFSEFTGSVIV